MLVSVMKIAIHFMMKAIPVMIPCKNKKEDTIGDIIVIEMWRWMYQSLMNMIKETHSLTGCTWRREYLISRNISRRLKWSWWQLNWRAVRPFGGKIWNMNASVKEGDLSKHERNSSKSWDRDFLLIVTNKKITWRFHNFKQADLSVEDYTWEFEYLMLKFDVLESKEQTIARFLGGLKKGVAT